jgi:hypothetical protein
MQDIYNHMPLTNHVSKVYGVVAVSYAQVMAHVECLVLVRYHFTQYVFSARYDCYL